MFSTTFRSRDLETYKNGNAFITPNFSAPSIHLLEIHLESVILLEYNYISFSITYIPQHSHFKIVMCRSYKSKFSYWLNRCNSEVSKILTILGQNQLTPLNPPYPIHSPSHPLRKPMSLQPLPAVRLINIALNSRLQAAPRNNSSRPRAIKRPRRQAFQNQRGLKNESTRAQYRLEARAQARAINAQARSLARAGR